MAAVIFPPSFLGTDTSCINDLQTIDTLVSGNTMLAQRLIRRLSVPDGAMSLIDPDPNAQLSIDLSALINEKFDDQTGISIQNQIQNVCTADQEVNSCFVQVIPPTIQNRTLLINVDIVAADGPFSLTISINYLTAQILYEIKVPPG